MSWLPHIPVRSEFDATENFQRIASTIIKGHGSPEGVVGASVATVFLREDGGPGSTLYVKEKARNPTDPYGWVPGGEVADTGWIDANLENGWENLEGGYPPVGFRRVGDRVHLRGAVKKGGTTATTLFTLPEGFRPPYKEFPAPGSELGAQTEIFISAAGVVKAAFTVSANFVLSDISFFTD